MKRPGEPGGALAWLKILLQGRSLKALSIYEVPDALYVTQVT